MALRLGTRLGPYEIAAHIDKGGMGEVYKARDTRLDRTVAIKVLPQHVASDRELKQRFEREAKTISSLNHPHICTLHDVGSQDGIDFLVLEHLEGETLAQRLTKGPVPLDQALQYAIQIADALAKAHGQGVVHRDLKPGNVMLTKSGAKLLDFGLAKLRSAVTVGGLAASAAPTVSSPITGAGSIVGTFQYMAPEQVEGKEADTRTDIHAFGAVLYEMLTGKRAFEGKSQASLIAAILDHQPTLPSAIQRLTPPAVDHVVATCLAKDPDERWQSASDLLRELRWIADSSGAIAATIASTTPGLRRSRRIWMVAMLAGGLVIGAVVTALVGPFERPSEEPSPEITRVLVDIAPADQLRAMVGDSSTAGDGRPGRTAMVVSADGRSIVFSAIRGSQQQLYLRLLTELEATPIAGTEGGFSPFFSPDEHWLGFMVAGSGGGPSSLWKMAFPPSGPPVKISDLGAFGPTGGLASPIVGASWGAEGTIVLGQGILNGGLSRVSAAGGKVEPLTTPDVSDDEFSHRLPFALPGGQAILFTVTHQDVAQWDATHIAVHSLATGERKILIKGGADARYVPTGHLVYLRAGTLMAVPFDLERLDVRGSPVALTANVMQAANVRAPGLDSGAGQFSVSASGTLVYVPGGVPPAVERLLLVVDRTGTERAVAVPPRGYAAPRFSPDGKSFAVGTLAVNDRNVWVADTRGSATRVTDGRNEVPVWAPDGKRLAFSSIVGTRTELAIGPVDGTGAIERLTTRGRPAWVQSWTPDGAALAFIETYPETGNDIWLLPLAGDRQPRALRRTRFNELLPAFSPDGRWLAYASNESGRPEVYVQPYPGPGPARPISTDGGTAPTWASNGRELFFMTPVAQGSDGVKMMAVSVTTGPSFTAGTPRALFEGRYVPSGLIRTYDVAPDGSRFLLTREVEQPRPKLNQMILVQNWTEELKRLVPTN